jgi:hypothetical protein
MLQVRWLHYSPEDRLGHYIPSRGRDGHMQYLPRAAGDPARLTPEEVERMLSHYTRLDARRLTMESSDSIMYVQRDPDEIERMYNALRTSTRNDQGTAGEFTRTAHLGSEGDVMHADPGMLDENHRAKRKPPMGHGDGYFGEALLHITASKEAPRLMALRNFALDGVHQADGRYVLLSNIRNNCVCVCVCVWKIEAMPCGQAFRMTILKDATTVFIVWSVDWNIPHVLKRPFSYLHLMFLSSTGASLTMIRFPQLPKHPRPRVSALV